MSKSSKSQPKASKATATTTVTTTSAKENRERHLKLNNGKPLVPLIGRTYLINAILWSIGSSYDKEAKQMSVPAHVHAAAQTLVAQVEALIPAKPVIIAAAVAATTATSPATKVEAPATTTEADRIAIAIMADRDASEEDLDQLELAVQEKRLSRPVRKLANKHLFALSRAA